MVRPQEVLYDHPATPFVFDFIGQAVRIPAQITHGVALVGGLEIPVAGHQTAKHRPGMLYVRPHHLEIQSGPGRRGWPAIVRRIHAVGAMARVELASTLFASCFEAHLPTSALGELGLAAGQEVGVHPRQGAAFLTS